MSSVITQAGENINHQRKVCKAIHLDPVELFLDESTMQLNKILFFNMDNMGYSDIPYNYIIDSNGSIYEGRGLNQGAHTYGFNDRSIGVAILGNYQG